MPFATRRLELTPRNWLSWDFRVEEAGQRIANIDTSLLREKAELIVAGERFEVGRESLLRGAFTLSSDGIELARASKPSWLHRKFSMEHDGKPYELRATSVLRRRFGLFLGNAQVGGMAPLHPMTRRARAEFPPDLPLPVVVFMTWLIIVLWKRDAGNGAGGS